MELFSIDAGKFKLDGGAMFGVVPKSIWNKLNPADENNQCTWALNSILIVDGDRKILVDTGIGNKQTDKFRTHFSPHGNSLESSLLSQGHTLESITDVFLTHLHFDHVGGAVVRLGEEFFPTFPNATYWMNRTHLDAAMSPNFREKASFLMDNIQPLLDADVVAFIDDSMRDNDGLVSFTKGIRIGFADGHTDQLMYLVLDDLKLVFASDLLPTSSHVRMPFVMSYDVRPLVTLVEKKKLYDFVLKKGYNIYFQHDPKYLNGTLIVDDQGRYSWSKLR